MRERIHKSRKRDLDNQKRETISANDINVQAKDDILPRGARQSKNWAIGRLLGYEVTSYLGTSNWIVRLLRNQPDSEFVSSVNKFLSIPGCKLPGENREDLLI